MAGDWIKMRNDLPEDPAVIGIAAILSIDEFSVVGRLHKFWAWADRQSRDGHAVGVTKAWIDRYVQCDGFASALESFGWLAVTDRGISIPNFDIHNGDSAKQRCTATKRQQKSRAKSTCDADESDLSRCERDKSVTREEKRREEEIQEEPNGSCRQADPKLPACPHDQIVSLYHEQLPDLPAVRIQSESRRKAMRKFWAWVLTSKKSNGQPRAQTADQALTWIGSYFDRVRGNAFLMGQQQGGRGHENWRADFDFLLTERGMKHVIEKTVDHA